MSEELTIFLALGGSALISTIVAAIVGWAIKKSKVKLQHIAELEAKESETKRREREIKMEQALLSEFRALLAPISESLVDIKSQIELDQAATIVTMRISLKNLLTHYKERGYAEASEVSTWHELYNNYKKMGGNHFKEYVDGWKSELESLPKKEDIKEK